MAHPYEHSRSSARKYGGVPEDYLELHNFFDQTKAHVPDSRHRLILHNSFGIFLLEQVFGEVFTRKSDGKTVRTRIIGEQHIMEDFGGYIPTLVEILNHFSLEPWMGRKAVPISELLKDHDDKEGVGI